MKAKVAASVICAAAAITLTSIAAAGPTAATQRVAITAKAGVYSFVLTPLKPGVLKSDSGTASWGAVEQHVVTRNGQTVEINEVRATLTGKRGGLAVRFRIEWVDAGNGYTVGTGKWTLVRGTGDYKQLTGGGSSAHTWLPRGPVSWRAEGFLGAR